MHVKAYRRHTWIILILCIGHCLCAVSITQSSTNTDKDSSLNLIATTDEDGVVWTFQGTTFQTSCSISSQFCFPGNYENMMFTANSVTNTSTIAISKLNCSINSKTYTASTTLDSNSVTIEVTTPISSVVSTTSLTASKVASQDLSVEVECVNLQNPITANYTVSISGKPDDILIPDSILPSLSNSVCECDEKTYVITKTITASQYPNEVVEVLANVGQLAPLTIGEVNFTAGQSTDSCDFNYCYCVGYILLAVFIASGISTLVVYLWWKIKRKEIKAKSILCWLAEHKFCCCGHHILCCCSQKIKSCCEKYKNSRICGAPVLLLADIFVIGMVVSIVVWFVSLLVVIFTYCACKEWPVKGTVAGISFVVSLFASSIWTLLVLIVYCIVSCCKNNGCVCKPDNRITKEAGDDVNFLKQRPHEFQRIESIELTKDGTPVSSDEYEVEMTAVPSLTLKMVSLDQSGMYECTISYVITKKEVHQLNLLVTPKQYEVKMGDRKTLLKCLKNLNGIKDVKWTHNNKAIPADSSFYKGGTQSNPSLTVKYCSTRDSGLYICNIRTTKSSKRFSAQLKTKDKYTVGSGKNIDLLKDLSSCRDVRKISWKLNGNPLDLVDNPAYIGGTIDCPVLNVLCATKQESGKYKCTLVLESLQTKELQFTLDLNEQLQVDSGESIVLLEQLGNYNNVSSVEWTHKKRPVTCFHKGGNIQCPALTIPVVSHEDSGEYNCKITLKQGNKRFYRFVVKVNVQKIKKKVGDRVVLLQNLKSAGTIQEIDWYKNGQKVQAGMDEKYQGGINQSPSLLVGSLQEHDSGLYKCDLIVKESEIKLHILVDLTVEQKENSTRLGPVIGHNRVHNHENAANNQSWTEEEQ